MFEEIVVIWTIWNITPKAKWLLNAPWNIVSNLFVHLIFSGSISLITLSFQTYIPLLLFYYHYDKSVLHVFGPFLFYWWVTWCGGPHAWWIFKKWANIYWRLVLVLHKLVLLHICFCFQRHLQWPEANLGHRLPRLFRKFQNWCHQTRPLVARKGECPFQDLLQWWHHARLQVRCCLFYPFRNRLNMFFNQEYCWALLIFVLFGNWYYHASH